MDNSETRVLQHNCTASVCLQDKVRPLNKSIFSSVLQRCSATDKGLFHKDETQTQGKRNKVSGKKLD